MCTGRTSTRTAFSFSAWEIFTRCSLKTRRRPPPCSTSPLPHVPRIRKTRYRWRASPSIQSIPTLADLSPPASAWRSASRSPNRTDGLSSSAASPASSRRGRGCRRTPTATERSRPVSSRAGTSLWRCWIPRAAPCAPVPSPLRAAFRSFRPLPPTKCFCGADRSTSSAKIVPLSPPATRWSATGGFRSRAGFSLALPQVEYIVVVRDGARRSRRGGGSGGHRRQIP